LRRTLFFRVAQSASATDSLSPITRHVGGANEKTSGWIVLASVGVVALAGVALRVRPSGPPLRRRQLMERRLEHERAIALERARALRSQALEASPQEAAAPLPAPPQPR
jgi:hypothetical protein